MTHNGFRRIDSKQLTTKNGILKFDSNRLTIKKKTSKTHNDTMIKTHNGKERKSKFASHLLFRYVTISINVPPYCIAYLLLLSSKLTSLNSPLSRASVLKQEAGCCDWRHGMLAAWGLPKVSWLLMLTDMGQTTVRWQLWHLSERAQRPEQTAHWAIKKLRFWFLALHSGSHIVWSIWCPSVPFIAKSINT